MDANRAQGCQFSSHSACASCGAVVVRRSRHVHTFGVTERQEEVLCGECWMITITASVAVLAACNSLDLHPGWRELLRMFREEELLVLVQARLS